MSIRTAILWKHAPLAGAIAASLSFGMILALVGRVLIGAADPAASAFVELKRTFALAAGAGGCAILVGAIAALCFGWLSRMQMHAAMAAVDARLSIRSQGEDC